jgi:hypothetical protein
MLQHLVRCCGTPVRRPCWNISVYGGGEGNVSNHEMIWTGKVHAIDLNALKRIRTKKNIEFCITVLPADRRNCPSLAAAPNAYMTRGIGIE